MLTLPDPLDFVEAEHTAPAAEAAPTEEAKAEEAAAPAEEEQKAAE